MVVSRPVRTLPALLLLVVALAPVASAHAHVAVGEHELTIGWQTEPPVIDQPNAVWVKVLGPAPKLDSGLFGPGQNYTFTFNEIGMFPYHCHPHPWMQGNVTVVDGGHHATPTMHHVRIIDNTTDANGYRYEPENITINKGDTIHFMLAEGSTMQHTVTAMSGDHAMHRGDMAGDDHAMGHGDMAEGAHDEHASPTTPVDGVGETLKVDVSIGGKTRTFDLKPLHGEPGIYVARFIPTVGGTYTAHFKGTVNGETVDVTQELQRVEALGDTQFPEKTDSLYELQKKVDGQAKEIAALKAKANAQADAPAKVTEKSNTPGVGLLALVGVGLVAATLMRRKE